MLLDVDAATVRTDFTHSLFPDYCSVDHKTESFHPIMNLNEAIGLDSGDGSHIHLNSINPSWHTCDIPSLGRSIQVKGEVKRHVQYSFLGN